MAYQAMLQQGMAKDEMVKYISKYLDEALEDINIKN